MAAPCHPHTHGHDLVMELDDDYFVESWKREYCLYWSMLMRKQYSVQFICIFKLFKLIVKISVQFLFILSYNMKNG